MLHSCQMISLRLSKFSHHLFSGHQWSSYISLMYTQHKFNISSFINIFIIIFSLFIRRYIFICSYIFIYFNAKLVFSLWVLLRSRAFSLFLLLHDFIIWITGTHILKTLIMVLNYVNIIVNYCAEYFVDRNCFIGF